MPFYSPLRYPGGKGRLGAWMGELMRANGISGGWYAEPYAGGAGVALHLLLEGYVRRVYINDIDPAIHAFWRAVLENPNAMMERVCATPVTLDERARQREVLQSSEEHTTLDVGFATLFMNRTSRSGILGGGPIGGKKQAGTWGIDARFNRENLANRIRLIGLHRNRIFLTSLDAMDFLDTLPDPTAGSGLIYLDPPYFHQGGELYRNAYNGDDHGAVAGAVRRLKHPWVVTYDDTKEVEDLYAWAEGGRFEVYYTANNLSRRHATELVYHGRLHLEPAPYSRR
ncbi:MULTISPECIES: DNA adenine methylase [unclassified Thioalkalivibrio]|uniref:DNA adenine methylase n=1 Tax=unclassified Thioalkalivibrio TaxID=2621013 RepID=UPI00035F287B|nr:MULTISPECIES: DNA adenine methylase [unclassified Thioalkalivibrio]